MSAKQKHRRPQHKKRVHILKEDSEADTNDAQVPNISHNGEEYNSHWEQTSQTKWNITASRGLAAYNANAKHFLKSL